ncbi:MAG: hypothetical protein VX834_00980 [Myxococcota bacterium]|nr:hypothetical protein [Myxococcota bacterium]
MIRSTLVAALCISLTAGCQSTSTDQPDSSAEPQYLTNRAIVGVSMGGGAAAQLGLSQPERWDFVGIIGAPLVDLRAFSRMIHRGWMGGFCSLEYLESLHSQGIDLNSEEAFCGLYTERALPELEPTRMMVPADWMEEDRAPMWEYTSDFNNWWRGHSGGRGAHYGRHSLVRAITDILKAYGSPLYEPNPEIPWAAPGVTQAWLDLSDAEKCANPVVHEGFYNAEYNPEGAYPVITFCNGNYDSDPRDSFEVQLARMLPDSPRTIPQALLLAVDINRNGIRDYGEPVISNPFERYDDFGTDALPSELEPGYDPDTNPDPAGDDYDAFTNPTGTENNYWFDEGETYLDYGLDGVANTGDFGEDSGEFERSPGWHHATQFDPHTLLEEIEPSALERLTIYIDAGIRDFLNTAIHSNRFFGRLEAMVGKDKAKAFNDFSSLAGANGVFDRFEPNYEIIPQYSYVRYGDPNASPEVIAAGDGNHVGTIEQAIDRAMNAFSLAQRIWPHADHTLVDNPFGDVRYADVDSYESQTLGRTQEFSYILPPGYHDPDNADKRYPVVFFLHGQGQRHTDQLGYSLMTQSAMVESASPNVAKWGKFIIIYPNGRCQGACYSGNFWTNFVSGKQEEKFHDDFYELVDVVDTKFRTLPAQTVP